jgi:hypothetical protein
MQFYDFMARETKDNLNGFSSLIFLPDGVREGKVQP